MKLRGTLICVPENDKQEVPTRVTLVRHAGSAVTQPTCFRGAESCMLRCENKLGFQMSEYESCLYPLYLGFFMGG